MRIQARINGDGTAGFCFRVPLIVNGELEGDGFEERIDAPGFNWNAGSLMSLANPGQVRMPRPAPNEWFLLEVIAVGRHFLVKFNRVITANLYDRIGRFRRGHFALHQIGESTDVRFRSVDVRRLDLGNDPEVIARGGQPRSLVAQSINGKQYMAFPQVLSWEEARDRCRKLGGCLAHPIDEEENRFLTKLARDHQMEGVWIGAHNKDFFDQWFAVDGSELQYQNFDDLRFQDPVDERSRQYYPLLLVRRDGKWYYQPDVPQNHRPGFICQWD